MKIAHQPSSNCFRVSRIKSRLSEYRTKGISCPLVATARPVRRVVYVNAVIPRTGEAFIDICQTEQVAVTGSLLDRLLKASQSITDDFLTLIHNPNATKAQLKAMQERIDASRC
jgi:hypothetical protein